MKQNIITPALQNIRITDPLFGRYADVVAEKLLTYQWEVLNDRIPGVEKSYSVENFRVAAGESSGQRQGAVFCDTDAYKWLEAVAYCLAGGKGKQYEQTADELIDLIAKAQEPDGYLDTYYTVLHPDKKWTNLAEGHELYCAGHLMEAAVAYTQATGKDKILSVACRLADLICQVFGQGKHPGYPSHPELELALMKLSRATGQKKYADMARYFLEVRGKGAPYLMEELKATGKDRIFPEFSDYTPNYAQEHVPPVQQTTAEGHAVRAMYLYSAMAYAAMRPKWKFLGILTFLVPVLIMTYYTVIGGWITKYAVVYITGQAGAAAQDDYFTSFITSPIAPVVGILFFISAIFATLTSCISVLESIVANCMEIFHTGRKKTVLLLSAIYLAASAVISLGYSIFYFEVKLPNDSKGQLLDIMDYISNSVMMLFIAILSTILIGWIMTPDYVIDEIQRNDETFRRKKLYRVMIRYVAPLMMLALFLQSTDILS